VLLKPPTATEPPPNAQLVRPPPTNA
jgi:hypothetical protein